MSATTFARIPTMVLELVEDRSIKLNQLGVYAMLSRHADNDSGQCWPSRKTIAKECGYRNADDVDQHLRALESAGVLTMQKRWCAADDPSDRAFVKSPRHSVPTSTLYTLTGIAATPTGKLPGTPTGEIRATVPGEFPPKLDPPELDPPELASVTPLADPPGFSEWWDAYPKSAGKIAARKAYAKALKSTTDPVTADELLRGAERYRDNRQRKPEYTKNATTWLNGGHWADEAETPKRTQGGGRLWQE